MQKITFNVTNDDLQNYEKHKEVVGDYPLYGATDGIGRTDMALISKLLEYDWGNDKMLKVTIEVTGKAKIDYKI